MNKDCEKDADILKRKCDLIRTNIKTTAKQAKKEAKSLNFFNSPSSGILGSEKVTQYMGNATGRDAGTIRSTIGNTISGLTRNTGSSFSFSLPSLPSFPSL
jgi:hypothetical protein